MLAAKRAPAALPKCVCMGYTSRRQAHAAAMEDDVDASTHPRARHVHQRRVRHGPPPGHKSRKTHNTSDYRFPIKGARGGTPSPYEVLDVPRTASPGEIKGAYYKLALVLHPDSSHPSASAEHFATLNKAYKLLSSDSGRTSYLQHGVGWSHAGKESNETAMDAAMREMARRAKANGAASWAEGSRARGGFRDSDAGRGGWAFYHTHPGEDFPFHDKPPTGGGKPLYMSNERFVALIASIAAVVAVFQISRIGKIADEHRDALVERHLAASNALAEARREAALHGKERRDQIRRRVRENAVMAEIGKMERGEYSEYKHHPHEVPRVEAPRGAMKAKQVSVGEQ